jgi:hypothetical protein
MAGTSWAVEELLLDPVEDVLLDERGLSSPPQPASMIAPSNPIAINRCIFQSPLVSSDLKKKDSPHKIRRGTYDSA